MLASDLILARCGRCVDDMPAEIDLTLLNSQKDEVFITIEKSGLKPREFEFADLASISDPPILVHGPSESWFQFGLNTVCYTPGEETQEQTVDQLNWAGKISMLRKWLGYLKREMKAPDLWASLAQEQELLGVEPAEAVNTPFNAAEQVQVKQAIEEIRVYITTIYTLEAEPLARVSRKLDYLIDASTRVGRKDWKVLFLGILFTLAVERLIPSGSGLQELFGIAGHLLQQVLRRGMSPPLLH